MAAVRGYGRRWDIEPLFSDCKSRGFGLETIQLCVPDRLLLIRALAMYWCVRTGLSQAPLRIAHSTASRRFQGPRR